MGFMLRRFIQVGEYHIPGKVGAKFVVLHCVPAAGSSGHVRIHGSQDGGGGITSREHLNQG